jgi:hypothetical protein
VAEALTPDDVLRRLKDVDYPADKDTLVSAAERSGASQDELRAIRAIPPVDYRNRDEVARSLRLDPAPGRSPGHAAEQARDDTKPGVAEPLRDLQQDRVKGEQRRTV